MGMGIGMGMSMGMSMSIGRTEAGAKAGAGARAGAYGRASAEERRVGEGGCRPESSTQVAPISRPQKCRERGGGVGRDETSFVSAESCD